MSSAARAVAIVGVGAILPDAPSAGQFWQNIINKRYSITDTPANRWSVADYFDPDPKAPDKTYSKIGGWVKEFEFDWRRFRMPPKVAAAMDQGQQWAVTIGADTLADYGYPQRPLNTERTAVILGTAMGGELHYITNQRVAFPEFANALATVPEFAGLPPTTRSTILDKWHGVIDHSFPPITEDSMPGELPNIISGRVANLLNLRGPNFITDAACASSFAALEAAVQMLTEHKVDAVLTGGVDRNMGVSTFVKFCKIGALSATGTRPFGKGADGFVMGEGAAAFLLKRLEDAERSGDKIYAVIRGVGGSSDGKGKGITAPNPIGQELAIRRAWDNAELDPATAALIEAHGTSTRVGDVVEVESLNKIFSQAARDSIGLGSAKSNIGHLKAGAGAAGLLKATFALHHKVLPPTLNAKEPNPNIEFGNSPFYLIHEPHDWATHAGTPRRAGVSAYGFGGTNFHVVMEEYVPGLLEQERKQYTAVQANGQGDRGTEEQKRENTPTPLHSAPLPPRGILALGAATPTDLKDRLDRVIERVKTGWTPPRELPGTAVLDQPERLLIDFGDHDELLQRLDRARKTMGFDNPKAWQAMEAQGIFRGSGKRSSGKIAFLFPGQGSQYVNMGRELVDLSPAVAAVFAEADRVMTPILGNPLTDYIFVDPDDSDAVANANFDLMQTAITQPAMLTLDIAMLKLLETYGFQPDMVMGHSLGEYAALIAAGIMPFAHALEAAAARGSEMSKVSMDDNGRMAAVLAPFDVVEATLTKVDGYVVPANINSASQCVIGGTSAAVDDAVSLFEADGYRAMLIPVSHAFHTKIVAPAGGPLRQMLDRLTIRPPQLPLVANVTGDFYPTAVTDIKDLLEKQIASPVQWVKGLKTLYDAGARTFVEVGPKRALRGFVRDVLGDRDDVLALMTNHPKWGALPSFNQALCGLYAAGHKPATAKRPSTSPPPVAAQPAPPKETPMPSEPNATPANPATNEQLNQLSQLLAQALQQSGQQAAGPYDRNHSPDGSVIVSGTGLGLPGAEKPIMDPDNALRILHGEQFVDLIPERFRQEMVARQITRLVKSADGSGSFATINDPDAVIKLAGRPGSFDLTREYGVPAKLVAALDSTTQLAMAAGLDALREAGIPLVQTYKRTTTGKHLPQKWQLPAALRDETGIIFASAFPGGDRFAEEFTRYYSYQNQISQLELLEELRAVTTDDNTLREINGRLTTLRRQLEADPYHFDRRFIFRILAMGHSQFAEYIGARGPNTQINAACASTTQGMALAEDWIRNGRCRRVIIIAADNVTSDNLMAWVGAGFLSLGAAATDDRVAEAALPFDRRRHGTILGMGACAMVLESEDAVRERGMRGIVELLSSEMRNSAFHGSRLDVSHIAMVMNDVVTAAERRFGLSRQAIAQQLVFMSHETYTPARGGSAAAEVTALRETFGAAASDIVVANTKGFTGHPMGVGVEDVITIKILEHGIVPPVPNYREVDPDLGQLNLSRGGRYPVQFGLHLAAGFGSQIAFSFTRRIPGSLNRIDNRQQYQSWLDAVSGYDYADTEVVQRVLRVEDQGAPPRRPAPNSWRHGTGPVIRAAYGDRPTTATAPPAPDIVPAPRPVSIPTTKPTPPPAPAVSPPAPELQAVKPAPSPEPPAPEPEPAHPTGDPIIEKVLAIVANQTGYPTDMLELDLDLEADLGVDTVKQAETFAAIRDEFDIPRRDDLNLRDYSTLEKVIRFVHDMKPELSGSAEEQRSGGETPPAPDSVTKKVLAIVAAQTGYPTDMLELDLDLEADLGVDTVKQAETFAAIREEFDIPRRDDLNLRDYNTLEKVIGFVHEMKPELSGGAEEQRSGGETPPAPSPEPQTPTYQLTDADQMPRRVPTATLRPFLDQCKATGVSLTGDSRVVVALDQGGVGKSLINRLEKLGVTVLAIDHPLATTDLTDQLESWLTAGPIQGVYWLTALDEEPALADMALDEWREANRIRVKNLAQTMRQLYDTISGDNNFLVTATRLGGLHGYGAVGASAPLGGAVTGFTKAYKRERPDVLVKAIDFASGRKTAVPADLLIAETLTDPGVVEIGYPDEESGERFTVTLREQPADAKPLTLDGDTIFLVTGAAGGITSAIVGDLAAASGGIFYLLDLVPAPDQDDQKVALFRSDQNALKQQLIAEAKAAGEKPTPVMIDKQMLAIERQEAALRAIETVEAAGGTAVYHSVNLLDGPVIASVVDEIRDEHGRIDVLIHAGGVEISKALNQKPAEQFDLVFDIKADGFFSLLKAAGEMPIGATVVFSSVAGRFGNNGQTDYSAANDLLCKLTSSLRRWRPETRAIAIDWTAWGGIGMATRGSIPKIMEMAGIDMLPPEAGVPTVRRELLHGGGEIVVGGALGMMVAEFDETGGLDLTQKREDVENLLLVGEVKAHRLYGGLVVETTLDPARQPFLFDHVMEGTPLLPGVMGTEAFAELATLAAPGYAIAAVENEDFHAPFKFYRMAPQTLYLSATAVPTGNEMQVHTTLRSVRELATGTQEKLHFTATVRMTKTPPQTKSIDFTPPAAINITPDAIYGVYFHGPAYQVLAGVSVNGDTAVGQLAVDLPPNSDPAGAAELMAPRLIELCFQTAGVWDIKTKGQMALPLAIGTVTAYRQEAEADGPLYAMVTAVDDGASFNARVVDADGNVYVDLQGYRTVQLPGAVEL